MTVKKSANIGQKESQICIDDIKIYKTTWFKQIKTLGNLLLFVLSIRDELMRVGECDETQGRMSSHLEALL